MKPKRGPVSNESEAGLPLTAKAKAAQVAQAIKQRQKALSLKQEKTPTITSGVHNRTSEAVLLEPEDDEGNVEYKLRLKQPNPVRFQQLVCTALPSEPLCTFRAEKWCRICIVISFLFTAKIFLRVCHLLVKSHSLAK